MKKHRICFFTVLLILFLLFTFFSCKSIPIQYPQNPFLVIGDTFSMYTVFDTNRDKKTLLQLVDVFLPTITKNSKESLLSYTKTLYVGFSPNEKAFSLFVEGNFPSLMKTQLTKKNGWIKNSYKSDSTSKKIDYYNYDDDFSLALVSKNLILVSNANIEPLLENYFLSFTMQNNPYLTQVLDTEKNPYTRLEKSVEDSHVLIYVKEPKSVLSTFIPFDADLALDSLFVYAKEREVDYVLDIDFIFSDTRAIRPALLLFKIAFFNDDIDIIQVSENQILLQGLEFSLFNR